MIFNKRTVTAVLALMMSIGSLGVQTIAAEGSYEQLHNDGISELAVSYSFEFDADTQMITGYVDEDPASSTTVNLVIPSQINGVDVIGIDEEAFTGWERLGRLIIENGVEYIGWGAFEDCVNLEYVYIPNTVTVIDEYAFYDATALEEVFFQNNSQLRVISWMAFAFTGLTEITIPESVTNIHEKAFRGCSSLMSVYFEGDAPQNLEEDQNAFSMCSSDLVLYFYEGKTGYSTPTWLGHTCVMIEAEA